MSKTSLVPIYLSNYKLFYSAPLLCSTEQVQSTEQASYSIALAKATR